MKYFLTLAGDVLPPVSDSGQALSVLYCPDFTCLLESRTISEHASLVAVWHPDLPRTSSDSEIDPPLEGRRIVLGALREDLNKYGEYTQDSKIGGRPGLLQVTGESNVSKLRRKQLEFLFQFNEESFPRKLKVRTYPFGFGAVYVFCQFLLARSSLGTATPGAFWQST
jgi:hypothetical protein